MYFTIKSIGICAILIIYPSSLTTTHSAMPFQSLYRERDMVEILKKDILVVKKRFFGNIGNLIIVRSKAIVH